MKKAIRDRLTYANVTATMALFIALGGSAYAALSIDGRDVLDGSLTGQDIRNGSLGHAEMSDQLAVSARRRGRRGRRGPRGRSGVTRVIVREGPTGDCEDSSCSFNGVEITNDVACGPGEHVVGGGAAGADGAVLVASGPSPTGGTPTGWAAKARPAQGGGSGRTKPRVWVLCAS